SVNEIVGNLGKDERTRFENELIRSQHIPFTILLEDVEGYKKIINGEYHSKYNPLALLGSLNTFKARYNFEIVYLDRKFSGNFIYYHFYYQMKNYLKRGVF
ncbi:nuclease, partial [Butyricicoccus sp. 1XD8-22]